MNNSIAILGAGNSGLTMAAFLALNGYEVKLWNRALNESEINSLYHEGLQRAYTSRLRYAPDGPAARLPDGSPARRQSPLVVFASRGGPCFFRSPNRRTIGLCQFYLDLGPPPSVANQTSGFECFVALLIPAYILL